MANKEQATKFLNLASSKYVDNKKKWSKYLTDRDVEFDEDVYSDTILKVYDYIIKNGITDDSDEGLLNYWFKSFVTNIKRDKMYSRNANRDKTVDAEVELDKETNGDYELQIKIRRDVFDDWCAVQLLTVAEQEFDSITFHCFRLYYIVPNMTYEKLREITNVKDCKKRVTTVKQWLKEHFNLHQLEKEFSKFYDSN